jgi:hypothetical protein
MDYKFNAARTAKWFLYNGIFWALSWFAFYSGSPGALNALTFLTGVLAVVSFGAFNSEARAKIQKKGPSMPLSIESFHDLFFTLLFAWHGCYWLALSMVCIAVCTQYAYTEPPKGEEVAE